MSNLTSNTTSLQAILDTINSLPEANDGVELPELTNPGTAADLLSGKELIDEEGNVVTGSIPTKTASNLSASGATVTVPAGYYASQATKSVSTATQATPSISVNSSGLITASATQTAGYVTAGTKSATKQLTTQGAQTITPGTSNKTIASGTYLTGTQTIKGDANLVAGNIKSGVSIFGVAGTLQEGTGGSSGSAAEWSANEDAMIMGTLSNYMNDRVTTICNYAFYSCSRLTTASFPAVTTIGSSAFYGCTSLTTVSFPACTSIGSYAFRACSSLTTASFPQATSIGHYAFYSCARLTTASFPAVTTIGSYAFYQCSSLTTVSFPAATTISSSAFCRCSRLATVSFPVATTIGPYAFYDCSRLTSVFLAKTAVVTLSHSNAFIGASVSKTGWFYVPSSLIASYQAATNWTYFSSRFSAIENSPDWDGEYGV